MTSRERAEDLYEELTYHSHRPDEVALIQRAIDEAVAEERARCKAVALHRADWWEKQPNDTEYNRALRDISQAEAYAIALNIGVK